MRSPRLPALVAAGLSTALMACTTDAPVEPGAQPTPGGPSHVIEDGAHGGNAHFFFLPPLVPTPSYGGSPDPSLLGSLAVEVCDLGPARPPANESCGSNPVFVATFTATTGTGSEVLRYDTGSDQYVANWHTDKSEGGTLQTSRYYRLRVLVAGTVLGQADIDPVRSASDLKNYDTGTSIPLVNGRTLPIKFRLEVGAVFKIGKDGGEAKTPDDKASVLVPADALAADVGVTLESAPLSPAELMEAGMIGGTSFDLGPDGTQFASAVTVTLAYDPARLPAGTDEADLRLYTLANGQWHLVTGSSVDAAGNTVSGETSHFSVYTVGIRAASTAFEPAWLPLAPGATAQLEAVTRDPDGNVLKDRAAAWTSSAPGAASVDESGLVTGESRGLALVSAVVEGASDTVNVLVETPSVVADKLAWSGGRDAIVGLYLLGADGIAVSRLTRGAPDGGEPTWSPNGARLAFSSGRDGDAEIFAMSREGQGVEQLTFNGVIDNEPDWSPDGSRIAFTSTRTGNFEIHVMNADGSSVANLSQNGAFDAEPDWSPDGSRIAFNSNRAAGNDDVWIMNHDGTGVTRFTANPAQDGQPAWSPDGSRIAWTSSRDGNFEIYVVEIGGSDTIRVTNHPAFDQHPSWAPDGESIVFFSARDGNEEIYSIPADGSGPAVRLTASSGSDLRPTWSPDGARIAFSSTRTGTHAIFTMSPDGSGQAVVDNHPTNGLEPDWSLDGARVAFVSTRQGNFDIYTMSADGSGVANITQNGAFDAEPAWSPDGTRIAFNSNRAGGNDDIWLMNADGSNPTRFTTHPGGDGQPDWSPMGDRLVWVSVESGNPDIWVADADGQNRTRLTQSTATDFHPVWSPDGSRIAFMSNRDGNAELYLMNVDGSNQTRLTFNGSEDDRPSWSPDGTRIAFMSGRTGNNDIYVIAADGTGLTRVTDHPAGEGHPTWRR